MAWCCLRKVLSNILWIWHGSVLGENRMISTVPGFLERVTHNNLKILRTARSPCMRWREHESLTLIGVSLKLHFLDCISSFTCTWSNTLTRMHMCTCTWNGKWGENRKRKWPFYIFFLCHSWEGEGSCWRGRPPYQDNGRETLLKQPFAALFLVSIYPNSESWNLRGIQLGWVKCGAEYIEYFHLFHQQYVCWQ